MMNQAIRDEMVRARLFGAEVAAEMGIAKSTMYYRLQRELTDAQKREFYDAIDRAAAKRTLAKCQ